MDETSVSEATQTVVAAVETAKEEAAKVTEAVIEAAAERVEEAIETAESVARAAIETDLGQRIENCNKDIGECRAENQNVKTELSALAATVTDLSAKIAELSKPPILAVEASPSSNPPPSVPTVEIPPLPVVEPLKQEAESVSEAALKVAETQDQKPQRRRIWT